MSREPLRCAIPSWEHVAIGGCQLVQLPPSIAAAPFLDRTRIRIVFASAALIRVNQAHSLPAAISFLEPAS